MKWITISYSMNTEGTLRIYLDGCLLSEVSDCNNLDEEGIMAIIDEEIRNSSYADKIEILEEGYYWK